MLKGGGPMADPVLVQRQFAELFKRQRYIDRQYSVVTGAPNSYLFHEDQVAAPFCPQAQVAGAIPHPPTGVTAVGGSLRATISWGPDYADPVLQGYTVYTNFANPIQVPSTSTS